MPSRTKLFDIPALPDSLLQKKYLLTTGVYNDPNSVDNFMKDALRYTGPDKPLHEEDLPRQSNNAMNRAIMSSREFGSRYSHAPFHPELFLGDLSKDPRLSTTAPCVEKMADHHRFRQTRYIAGKLQDNRTAGLEGMVGTKRMLRQIKQGFNDRATRMAGIFDDSFNTLQSRSNPHPGDARHKVGDMLKEDQRIYEVGDEKILPQYSTDIVSQLSNKVGTEWGVQSDQRMGLSSVSNVYRSKQDVDQAAAAVFRLGQQETSFKHEADSFVGTGKVHSLRDLKRARRNAQDNFRSVAKKDSFWPSVQRGVLPPPVPVLTDRFVSTHKPMPEQKEAVAMVYKHHAGNPQAESLVEPLTTDSGYVPARPTTIPNNDRIAIMHKVSADQKQAGRAEETFRVQRILGAERFAQTFTGRRETMADHIAARAVELVTYSTPSQPTVLDHVSSVRMTPGRFAPKESTATNQTGSNKLPTPSVPGDFKYDTDPTMDNNYMTRTGTTMRGSHLTPLQQLDSVISPVTDIVAPFRTKYST